MNPQKSPRLPIVSPPPSANPTTGSTNLDAALAHVKPQAKRLLPQLPQLKKK